MKTLLATLIVLTASSASAEGPSAPGGYDWTGIYTGVHAGFGRQAISGMFDQGGPPGGPYDLSTFDVNGVAGGVHLGVNKQWNTLVLGVEGDISASDLSAKRDGAPFPGSTIGVEANVNLLASLRGRAGVAFDNLLLYGTGGIGFAKYSFTSTFTGIGFVPESASVFGQGWGAVYGAGLEYGKGNVVFRLEALHYDVKSSFMFAGGEIPDADAGDFINWGGVTVVRAGLSYKVPVVGQ